MYCFLHKMEYFRHWTAKRLSHFTHWFCGMISLQQNKNVHNNRVSLLPNKFCAAVFKLYSVLISGRRPVSVFSFPLLCYFRRSPGMRLIHLAATSWHPSLTLRQCIKMCRSAHITFHFCSRSYSDVLTHAFSDRYFSI